MFPDALDCIPMNDSSGRRACASAAALCAATLLAACGSSVSPSLSAHVSARPTLQAGSQFDAGVLGSATNYRATYTFGSGSTAETLTYVVHSPSNWEEFTGGTKPLIIVMNGTAYTSVPTISGSSVTYSWKKAAPQPYKTTPYPETVAAIMRESGTPQLKFARTGSCTDGSASGTAWKSEPAAPGAVIPLVALCTDTHSGVLLWYAMGVGNIQMTTVLPVHATSTLVVSDLGTVPAVTLPS